MQSAAKLKFFTALIVGAFALGGPALCCLMLSVPEAAAAPRQKSLPPEYAMLERARQLRLNLKTEAALQVLNETILRYPKFIDAIDYRSDLEREVGDMKGALADMNKILSLLPGHVDYTKKRAKIYDMNGRLKEAIADYDYVLTKQPDALSIWRDRGVAHKRLKEYALAAADFDKTVAMGSKHRDFNDYLYDCSQMHLFAGDLPKAMSYANQLIKTFPQMSKGLWMRAQVYDKLNKPELAKADRARAKVLDENFDPIEKF
ncbi:MAG: tetratricopeptide repeat protein [Cyanobacteria bacterium SZAS TMP-1]|nr:tetratricopeptide repeat protein [Cyanobacteria bacterium SZAS TMP-1]